MKYKVLKAEHNGLKFKIEEYTPNGAAYLSVYENGECIYDYLKDNIEICKEFALEKHAVPLEIWIEKDENANIINYIILFSASALILLLSDMIFAIIRDADPFLILLGKDIFIRILLIVGIIQIIGIIISVMKLKESISKKIKILLYIYIFIASIYVVFLGLVYLIGSSMTIPQPY